MRLEMGSKFMASGKPHISSFELPAGRKLGIYTRAEESERLRTYQMRESKIPMQLGITNIKVKRRDLKRLLIL